MKICVCVKHVPDTAATIKIDGENGFLDDEIKFVVNPYDEYGLEEAVSLVEKDGGEVVVVTVGKPAAADTIRGALAMGAHRAILVECQGQFLDAGLTARALKAAMEKDGLPDMIFAGKGSVDTESFQTIYRLGHALGMPVVNEVSQLSVNGDKVVAEQEVGGGDRQVIEMSAPCVIGATKGLNEPRYPKFPDIMKAKKKKIDTMSLGDLGIDEADAAVTVQKLEPVPERTGAKMIDGAVEEQVTELIRILKEDEKVL